MTYENPLQARLSPIQRILRAQLGYEPESELGLGAF